MARVICCYFFVLFINHNQLFGSTSPKESWIKSCFCFRHPPEGIHIAYLRTNEVNYSDTLDFLRSIGVEHHVFLGSSSLFLLDAASMNRHKDATRDYIFLFHKSDSVRTLWVDTIFPLLGRCERATDFTNSLIDELIQNSSRYFTSPICHRDPDLETESVHNVSPVSHRRLLEANNLELTYEVENLCYRILQGASFLTPSREGEEARYQYIREMHMRNHLRFFQGDVTKPDVFAQVAAEIHQTGEQLAMVYFSHALPGEGDEALRSANWTSSVNPELPDFLENFHRFPDATLSKRPLLTVAPHVLFMRKGATFSSPSGSTSSPSAASKSATTQGSSSDIVIDFLTEYVVAEINTYDPVILRTRFPIESHQPGPRFRGAERPLPLADQYRILDHFL